MTMPFAGHHGQRAHMGGPHSRESALHSNYLCLILVQHNHLGVLKLQRLVSVQVIHLLSRGVLLSVRCQAVCPILANN